jgi:hypothetical protein
VADVRRPLLEDRHLPGKHNQQAHGDSGPGVPDDGLGDFDPISTAEGTYGNLHMGVDSSGDVRWAFHEDGNARAVDMSGDELDELHTTLRRVLADRDDAIDDGDTSANEIYADDEFGDGMHRVELYGSGIIGIVFGGGDPDDDDPYTLLLDPPDEDEDSDDVAGVLDAIEDVLNELDVDPAERSMSQRDSGGYADDEPDGPLDEHTQVLLAAISELALAARVKFDPSDHPRNPKGAAGGGRFRSNVDRLKDALKAHKAGGGTGDPFEGFDREQLRRVAKARGIDLKRGEGRESIAQKLMAHLDEGKPAAAEKPPTPAAPAAPKKRAPRKRKAAEPAGETTPHDAGRATLARIVEHGTVANNKPLSGGLMGEVQLRTYNDGTKTVWKQAKTIGNVSAKQQSDAEELAPLIAHALGLRAPTVVRASGDTVHMEFVDNARSTAELEVVDNSLLGSTEGRMIGLLDLLTSNADRNAGNVMVLDGGKGIVPIDHGLAFRYIRGEYDRDDNPARPDRGISSGYTSHWFKPFNQTWIDNDLTPADVAEIRQRLQRRKADFDRLDRGDWYKFALARLDALAPYAKGATSRLLPEVT